MIACNVITQIHWFKKAAPAWALKWLIVNIGMVQRFVIIARRSA
jgi:hypothetical protein